MFYLILLIDQVWCWKFKGDDEKWVEFYYCKEKLFQVRLCNFLKIFWKRFEVLFVIEM